MTFSSITTELVDGDLVFLYLAQDGVSITDPTSRVYGSLTSVTTTSAGSWQINRILSRSGDDVYLECELAPEFLNRPASINGYHTMVITKFFLANTISFFSFTTISAPPFSSQATGVIANSGGGVVAMLAKSIIMADGSTITADAAGFSGGEGAFAIPPCVNCNNATAPCRTEDFSYINPNFGAQRGSSIAAYSEDPLVRFYGRGALANGGGGGNNQNAPGGGGANVCSDADYLPWTGDGVCVLFFFPSRFAFDSSSLL